MDEAGDAGREVLISVLGTLRAQRQGEDLDLRGPRPRLLLALLIAAAGAPVAFDRLIDELYEGDPPPTARKSAQVHVSNLRRALGDAVLVTTPNGYRFDPGSAEVDATAFEREVRAAATLTTTDPARASARLSDALDRWRGAPYADFDDHPTLHAEAVRLDELRLRALEIRIEADLRLGRHADVLAELETLTTDHPYREELRALQMLALYRSGRQADALRVFGRTRALLLDELGIDPSERLRELERQILGQSPELELVAVPGRTTRAVLATDIEGSTAMWEHDPEAMGRALTEHDEIVKRAVADRGGTVFKHTGDGVFAVFDGIGDAIAAAIDAQTRLRSTAWPTATPIRVRAAVDEGLCEERNGDYFGPAVNRVARVMSAAHGGQLVAPESTLAWVDVEARPLGEFDLRGVGRLAIHQITAAGLDEEFPELVTDRTPSSVIRPGFTRSIRGYELRQQLGEGDFGVVFRAYQASVGREVAIKAIRPELANRPDFVKRFEAEAQFVAQLEHPHIVSLYDYWRDPDGAYLVMPLLAGGSVAAALERGPWNPPAVLRLAEQVGSALGYAHRNGVTHRDIKPANVLLDTDGNAYLSDFGIATRSIDLGPDTTSIVYQAPEQLAGGPAGARSDLYCFALLVHELLTGERTALGTAPRPPHEARHDLPAALEHPFARAANADPARRFDRVDDFLRQLRQAFGADVSTGAAPPSTEPVRNPFKGLRAFAEVDARDFHGREGLVEELIGTLRQHGFVAAVGPSGSGKSSVVKAGVLPAVRAGALGADRDVVIAEMFPGTYPFEELEAALLRVAVDRPDGLVGDLGDDDRGLLRVSKRILPDDDTALLLVIDQFEELFSLVTDDQTRSRFLANLVTVARDERSRVTVLATMRADFFDRPLRYPEFAQILERGLVPVAMPSEENLALAIAQPARAVGLDLEPGLVAAIVGDVGNEPGALPLLQYAMTELVERAEGRTLTNDAYAAIGRASGALARRAEEIYEGLSPSRRAAARDLFLRLVTVSDEADDTRRRVRRSELATMAVDQAALDAVVDEYGAFRLLSFDHDPVTRGPTVEVAHEALIREWPRYREWIDERRDDLLLSRRLETASREWDDGGRDPSFLLRGGRLEQYREWTTTTDLRITVLEREYLAESERLDEELALEAAEHERRDESLRRRSRLLLASAAAAVVMLLLAGLALVSRNRANDERARAARLVEEGDAFTIARRVAAESIALAETDPETALSLAVAAVKTTEPLGRADEDAVDALHFALQAIGTTFPADSETPVAVRNSPTGRRGVFVLPVDELVALAQRHPVRPLGSDDCARHYSTVACPDVLAPLVGPLELALGADSYFAYTDAGSPLSGTIVTLAGWELEGTASDMMNGIKRALGDSGIQLLYEQVDVRDPSVPSAAIDLIYAEQLPWVRGAVEGGHLIDLGPMFGPGELHEVLGPEITEFGTASDGSLRAVPVNVIDRSSIYYDADRFAAMGYSIPSTWDELIELSDRIVSDGEVPWCWGNGRVDDFTTFFVVPGSFVPSDLVASVLLGEFGPETVHDWSEGELPFDSEPVRTAFERVMGLLHGDGYTGSVTAAEALDINWPAPFADYGNAAINPDTDRPECLMIVGPSIGSYFEFSDVLDHFPVPPVDPANAGYMIGSAYLMGVTEDRPENRAVLRAMIDDVFFDVWLDAAGGYIAPLLDYEWDHPVPDDSPEFGAFDRDLRLIERYQQAVTSGRFVYSPAWDGMPLDVGMRAIWDVPIRLFLDGPSALDEVLARLDEARARAAR